MRQRYRISEFYDTGFSTYPSATGIHSWSRELGFQLTPVQNIAPTLRLNTQGDKTVIEVTIELGVVPWKRTWHWQLNTEREEPTLVALGEVSSTWAEGAKGSVIAPVQIAGSYSEHDVLGAATWPAPETPPAVRHFGTYPIIQEYVAIEIGLSAHLASLFLASESFTNHETAR